MLVSFNSLQTGERIQRDIILTYLMAVLSFNSLQTGKRIQSRHCSIKCMPSVNVSIPFKRESVFKVYLINWFSDEIVYGFQFPSNGKAYSKSLNSSLRQRLILFQFPSNGKAYSKVWLQYAPTGGVGVSIPFKRESVFKELQRQIVYEFYILDSFNSLQTGKRIQSSTCILYIIYMYILVSIPFKRESVFKEWWYYCYGRLFRRVSIPFKRESVFKVGRTICSSPASHLSFNSLQTGKCIQSLLGIRYNPMKRKFQFPSNGKVYSKQESDNGTPKQINVSIPFKRESVFKVFSHLAVGTSNSPL